MKEHEALGSLAAFLSFVSKDDFCAGRWVDLNKGNTDILVMPCVRYDQVVDSLIETAYRAGWVVPFDWPRWARSDEALELVEDSEAIYRANFDQLQRLLTWRIRLDRFREGSLLADFESGMMLRVIERAMVLHLAKGSAD